jgi:hypothetical protein
MNDSVLVPLAAGRWRAFFPDFPACEAVASDLDLIAMHAARALAHHAETSPEEIWVAPPPRDLRDIRSDETWVRRACDRLAPLCHPDDPPEHCNRSNPL